MAIDPKFIIQRSGKPFVLYAGLLAEAHANGLTGIRTEVLQIPDDHNGQMAIVAATVTMGDGRTFSEIGDATPANVGPNIKAHILRMAATRAKARALRDAVNVGMTAVEELADDDHEPAKPPVRVEVEDDRLAKLRDKWSKLRADGAKLGLEVGAMPTDYATAFAAAQEWWDAIQDANSAKRR